MPDLTANCSELRELQELIKHILLQASNPKKQKGKDASVTLFGKGDDG